MRLTTGILIAGKMSVGVLVTTKGVIKSTSKAATTNVYGRRRARRTIHITFLRRGYGHTNSPSWPNSRSATYEPPSRIWGICPDMNDGGSLFRGNSQPDKMSTSFRFDDSSFKRFGRTRFLPRPNGNDQFWRPNCERVDNGHSPILHSALPAQSHLSPRCFGGPIKLFA